ncbi:hypothetical protein VPH35_053168 [Triticum aestivum]
MGVPPKSRSNSCATSCHRVHMTVDGVSPVCMLVLVGGFVQLTDGLLQARRGVECLRPSPLAVHTTRPCGAGRICVQSACSAHVPSTPHRRHEHSVHHIFAM